MTDTNHKGVEALLDATEGLLRLRGADRLCKRTQVADRRDRLERDEPAVETLLLLLHDLLAA